MCDLNNVSHHIILYGNKYFFFETNLYTIPTDLFRIDCCVILYLQYDMNMYKIRIELAIYIEIY